MGDMDFKNMIGEAIATMIMMMMVAVMVVVMTAN